VRLGILTLHDSVNYGALAQAYALSRHLAGLGHHVSVIDRRRDSVAVAVRTPQLPAADYRLLGMFPVSANNLAVECALRVERTQAFLSHRIGVTDYRFHDWRDAPSDLGIDAVVIGSDQVWNSNNLDPADYLPLQGPLASVPCISYAASIGMPELPVARVDDFRRGIATLKAVSVREREAADIVRQLGGEVELVADPVLLAGRDVWNEVLADCRESGGRVFAYFLAEDFPRLFGPLARLAASRRTRVDFFADWFCLGPVRKWKQCRRNARRVRGWAADGIDIRAEAGPEQFVRSLAAAEVVVTNSYHAMVFAMLFGKPVRVVLPTHPVRQAMNARLEELAAAFMTGPVIHRDLDSAVDSLLAGDACAVRTQELARFRSQSVDWLSRALERCVA